MENETTRMSKRKFRIGDLAEELDLKKFVIRFWEKEFNLQSDRSFGGQRYYTEDDLAQFSMIKDLLYNKGFTIVGARQQLKTLKKRPNGIEKIENPLEKEEIPEALCTPQTTEETIKTHENPEVQPASFEKIIVEYVPKIPESFIQTVKQAKEKLLKIKNSLE